MVDGLPCVFLPHLSSIGTTNILLGPLLMVSIDAVHFDFVGNGVGEDRYKSCRHCLMPY